MIIEETENGVKTREEFGVYAREVSKRDAEIAEINKFIYADRNILDKLILHLHLDIPSKEQLIKRRDMLFAEIEELKKVDELYLFEEEFYMGEQEPKSSIEFTPIKSAKMKK